LGPWARSGIWWRPSSWRSFSRTRMRERAGRRLRGWAGPDGPRVTLGLTGGGHQKKRPIQFQPEPLPKGPRLFASQRLQVAGSVDHPENHDSVAPQEVDDSVFADQDLPELLPSKLRDNPANLGVIVQRLTAFHQPVHEGDGS